MNISSAGRIEMNAIDTPASVPSSAARGVILRTIGATKPPAISTKLCTNTQTRPASQPLIGIAGLERDRQHDHEHDDEHVRHADARRQRADVGASGPLRETIREPRVVARRQRHHQPGGRQDAPEHELVGHLEDEAQKARQHEHVDEDVGAEAEERVPVARRPQRRLVRGHVVVSLARTGRGGAAPDSAASTRRESETQPKIPPCALIMARPAAWNSGK